MFLIIGIMFSILEFVVVWNVILMVVNEMRWFFFVVFELLMLGVIWSIDIFKKWEKIFLKICVYLKDINLYIRIKCKVINFYENFICIKILFLKWYESVLLKVKILLLINSWIIFVELRWILMMVELFRCWDIKDV